MLLIRIHTHLKTCLWVLRYNVNWVKFRVQITKSYPYFYLQSEILLKICSYLDLVSLCRMSQSCRKFHQVASDPSLYTEINLMPYWDVVDASVLNTFRQRCRFLKKVDLSWCGLFNNLTSSHFNEWVFLCVHKSIMWFWCESDSHFVV